MLQKDRAPNASSVARVLIAAAAAMLLMQFGQPAQARRALTQAASNLQITTKALPDATVGIEYYCVMAASGGETPYDFSGTGLPPNLAFHYASDTIGGKATTPGAYTVVITVKDSSDPQKSASVTMKLNVLAGK
jgi:Putative Ig domain